MNNKKIGILLSSLFTNRIFINKKIDSDFVLISNWDKKHFDCKHFSAFNYYPKQNRIIAFLKKYNDIWYQRRYPTNSKKIMDKFFNIKFKYKSKLFFWNSIIAKKIISIFCYDKMIEIKIKRLNLKSLVIFNPYAVQELLFAIIAKKLGVKIYFYITSWDNITTKTIIPLDPDGILVWSKMTIKNIDKFYPHWKNIKKEIVGAPQFDHFFDNKLIMSKKIFMRKYFKNIELPIILYTLGSPNFLKKEFLIFKKFLDTIKKNGIINKINLLVRLHPDKDSEHMLNGITNNKNIFIQKNYNSIENYRIQNKEEITKWINTFIHSDLIISSGSTTIIDASVVKKPHINIAKSLIDNDVSFGEVIMNFEHLKQLHDMNLLLNVFSFNQFISYLEKFIRNGEIINNSSKIVEKVLQIQPSKSTDTLFNKIHLLNGEFD